MRGTGRVDEICQHSESGIAKVPGTGLGGWFASIQAVAKVPGTFVNCTFVNSRIGMLAIDSGGLGGKR